jgi:ribosomal protein L30
MAKLLITYKKSAIGYSKDQKATIRSLGLHKLNSTAIQNDTPSIRGMIFKVRHLVKVEEISDTATVERPQTVRPAVQAATKTTKTLVAPAATAEVAADDLEVIEGIGPKISSVLKAAGISTFAQLAAASVAQLTEILQAADLRLAVPETWPEQAALAAAGNWDELKQLQDRLKGGRREG